MLRNPVLVFRPNGAVTRIFTYGPNAARITSVFDTRSVFAVVPQALRPVFEDVWHNGEEAGWMESGNIE